MSNNSARSVLGPLFAAAAVGFLAFSAIGFATPAEAGQYGPDECRNGYVWRDSRPGDHVCVTPAERARVRAENQIKGQLYQPGGGAYGAKTCLNGLVWREAFDGDTTCVTPQERRRAKMNNAEAEGRFKY